MSFMSRINFPANPTIYHPLQTSQSLICNALQLLILALQGQDIYVTFAAGGANYIIDALQLHDTLSSKLQPIFADPGVLKVACAKFPHIFDFHCICLVPASLCMWLHLAPFVKYYQMTANPSGTFLVLFKLLLCLA